MYQRLSWVMICLGTTVISADEVSSPGKQPAEQIPLPRSSTGDTDSTPRSSLADLKSHLLKLKEERDALNQERAKVTQLIEAPSVPEAEEAAKLRLHLGGLLTQMGTQRASQRMFPPLRPSQEQPKVKQPSAGPKDTTETGDKPVTLPALTVNPTSAADAIPVLDPLALAMALFRAGNYESALQAYRLISLEGMKAEERSPLQYMMATCLRKMNKHEDAGVLYREVANSKGDEQMAACAQWQLAAMRWRRDLESQLRDVQQRRQALEAIRE